MLDASKSIEEFASAAATRHPTPGAGGVIALVGALAAAMGELTINVSLSDKDLDAYGDEFRPALAEMQRVRKLMLHLMAEAQVAAEALEALAKFPQGSSQRIARFDSTLLTCVRFPQAIAAASVSILEMCDKLTSLISHHLLPDLAVSSDLAMATIRCALYNVRANLNDCLEDDRQSIESTMQHILSRALTLIQSIAPRIWDRHEQGS